MTKMDREYYSVTDALGSLTHRVQDIQSAEFEVQTSTASSMQRVEYLIAGLIVLMVSFVAVYGHKLSIRVKETNATLETLATEADDKAQLAEQRYQELQVAFRAADNLRAALNQHATRLEATNLELEAQKEEAEAINAELKKLNNFLDAARADATQATKAKSDFLANMSHEIRTPMTAILGYSENLRDGGLSDAETHGAIDTIHKNGEYLLTIINDILDMSKIEAGKMEVEHIACSPHDIIADVATLMKVRTDKKKIAFNTEYLGPIPETIQSDPTRLKQILINIIGNAIKFTEEGGVRLITRFVPTESLPENCGTGVPPVGSPPRRRCHKESADSQTPGAFLQFDVLDTGVGMTEEQVGNLFQAFSQADSTMSRKFGGTGLGLTISKSFAELLGGDITIVDTEVGRGTRFRTTIATGSLDGVKMVDAPRSATVGASGGTAQAKARGSAKAAGSSKLDCRILLAEDGVDNQRLIAFIMKKAGAEMTVVENGKLALDAALAARDEGKPFDVILMDMQMPVMDGYEATGQLRNEGYTGPIVALTAHAMASDRQKCLNAGCDDYATKPVDRKKLVAMIEAHLQVATT